MVGPRYHRSASAGGTSRFPATAHLKEGEASRSAFDLHVHFASPLPVSELRSTTHGIEVSGEGTGAAEVELVDAGARNDRDFILTYRLAGERTATGLTLFRGDGSAGAGELLPRGGRGRPGHRRADQPARIRLRGRHLGSMRPAAGHRQALLRNLIGNLRQSDSFNVLLFSGSSQMLSAAPVPATRVNIDAPSR